MYQYNIELMDENRVSDANARYRLIRYNLGSEWFRDKMSQEEVEDDLTYQQAEELKRKFEESALTSMID